MLPTERLRRPRARPACARACVWSQWCFMWGGVCYGFVPRPGFRSGTLGVGARVGAVTEATVRWLSRQGAAALPGSYGSTGAPCHALPGRVGGATWRA
jgi:hypothetical protein